MTETAAAFLPWSGEETRAYHDAEMIAAAWYEARDELARYPGWLTWKKNGAGTEYLFQGSDRAGNGKSLGLRSPETEQRFEAFREAKQAARQRESALRDQVAIQARFVRAARVNRMPRDAAKLLRTFERTPFREALMVVGTHALYAYEAAAGVRFIPGLTATRDVDLLWDSKRELEVSVGLADDQRPGFLEILRQLDATFTVGTEHSFRVTSAQGLMVDFLMAEPDDGRKPKSGDKVRPIGLVGQAWLLGIAPMRQIAFSHDGYPIRLRVPQPTIFAAHKSWLAHLRSRAATKRERDGAQALAVFDLLRTCLADQVSVKRGIPAELKKYLPVK